MRAHSISDGAGANDAEVELGILRAAIEADLDAYVLLDVIRDHTGAITDFRYRLANPKACEYLGVRRTVLLGALHSDVFADRIDVELLDAYRRTAETGIPLVQRDQSLVNDATGREHQFEVQCVRAGEGLALWWRDITIEVEAVAALELQRARMLAMQDSMLDPQLLLQAVRDESGAIVDLVCIEANAAACTALQLTHDEIVGTHLLNALLGDANVLIPFADRIISSGRPTVLDDFPYSHALLGPDEHRFDVRAVPVGDGVSYTWRDVTHRYNVAKAIAQSEERYRLLAENSTDVVMHAHEGLIVWVSPSLTDLLGWRPDEWIGHIFTEFSHPDEVAQLRHIQSQMALGKAALVQVRVRDSKNQWHWASAHAKPYVAADSRVFGSITSFRVVDDEVAALRRLEDERSLLRAVQDSMLDPQVLVEAVRDDSGVVEDFVIVEANAPAGEHLGIPREALIGCHLRDLAEPGAGPALRTLLATALSVTGPLIVDELTDPWRPSSGRRIDFRCTQVNELVSCTWRDDTNRFEAEQTMRRRAEIDSLTGLLNRGEVINRLERAAAQAPRSGDETGVLFCDIDSFKLVNDTYGHAAGDIVLCAVAERVTSSVRQGDIVARFGGDEIIVVLNGVHDLESAIQVGEKIRALAAEPILVPGSEISITVSIGVTLCAPGEIPDHYLVRADRAMYRAKKEGRDRVIAIPPADSGL